MSISVGFLFILLNMPIAGHAAQPWRVVILTGADPTQPAALDQIRALRSALVEAAPDGVEFYTDPLDGLRFDGGELIPEFLALMTKKYARKQVDIVIGLADFALDFTARYHEQIWPGTPVLITSVEEDLLRARGLPAGFAHATMRLDIDGTIALAEMLQPDARRLIVVGGSTTLDRYWTQRTVSVASQRTSRAWKVEAWSGLPVPELRERVAKLDKSAAVVFTTMYRDRDGRTFFPYEVVRAITEASGAPVYSWYPTYLANGLTAGSVISFEKNGRLAGNLAASILQGKTPRFGATSPPEQSQCAANVARMETLGLDTGSLPRGCQLVNEPPSLWREYRGVVLITLGVLSMQAFTIAALLWQRRRRRAAEDEATLRRSELARAARFASAGELSASIAHEVGQPLGAILSNADAAEFMLQGQSPETSELRAILADVRRDALRANQVVQRLRALLQKHPVVFDRLELDATLDEALALLGPEARRRQLTIETNLRAGNGRIRGDRIQLEQVLLNLAINAMDAMQDVKPERRVLSIATRAFDQGFELTVSDRGHGIPAEAHTRLFESLYTTKPHGMGLGLSIVRTIVESHGGRVAVAAREGGGSVFTVWLPADAMATSSPAPAGSLGAVAKDTGGDAPEPRPSTQGGHP